MRWLETLSTNRLSWPVMVFVLITILVYAATLPSIGSYLDNNDMYTVYALSGLDALHPGFLENDYFYGAGRLTAVMPKVYELGFRVLAVMSGDVVRALEWMWVLCLLVYVPGMFCLTWVIARNWPVALLVTWLSVGQNWLTVSGTYWGIWPHISPLVFYAAVYPLALILAWRWTTGSSRQGPSPTWWQALALGLLLGFGNEAHPVSAIGGAELIGGWLIWQALRGRTRLVNVVVYGVALVPGFSSRLLSVLGVEGGVSGVGVATIEQTVLDFGSRNGLLFPWARDAGTPGIAPASFFHVEGAGPLLILIGVYIALTLFLSLAGWRVYRRERKVPRGWLGTFVLVQTLWLPFVVRFGMAWAVVGVYWGWRIYRDELDETDWTLLALWTIASWLGIIQQLVMLGLWQGTQFTTFSLIASEAARLGRFVYPITYLILARALLRNTAPISRRELRVVVVVVLVILLGQGQGYPITPDEAQLALLALTLALVAWPWWERRVGWPWAGRDYVLAFVSAALVFALAWLGLHGLGIPARRPPVLMAIAVVLFVLALRVGKTWVGRGVLGSGAAVALGAALIMNVWVPDYGTARLFQALRDAPFAALPAEDTAPVVEASRVLVDPAGLLPADYVALADWIRDHTPSGSVIYIDDNNSARFRAMAERPITHLAADSSTAFYFGHNPNDVLARDARLNAAVSDPEALLHEAATAGADYLVLPATVPYTLELPLVYANESYTVYEYTRETD